MKYSKELVEELSKHIGAGLTAKEASVLSDISEETFYDWQRPDSKQFHSEFSEAIKKAVVLRKEYLLVSIRQDRSWQSKAWLAERLYPELQQLSYINQRIGEIERKLDEIEVSKVEEPEASLNGSNYESDN